MTNVRNASDADESAVYELALTFPSPTQIDRETFAVTWNEKLADGNAFTCVAEDSGEIVGYAAGYMHRPFYANGATFWLDEVLVKEECRGEGIGRELLDKIESWAKSKGCKQILLASSKKGGFYEIMGFKCTAQYFKKYL